MGLWTHYIPLPNFDNYHFSNLILSLPLLILLEYVKAKSTSFHLQIVLYELLTNKGFLFNHLTIITPKQSLAILQYQLLGGNPSTKAEDAGLIPALGRSPGSSAATHSSILALKILWTEEPGGLQSPGSQRPGRAWATEHTAKPRARHAPIITILWSCKCDCLPPASLHLLHDRVHAPPRGQNTAAQLSLPAPPLGPYALTFPAP